MTGNKKGSGQGAGQKGADKRSSRGGSSQSSNNRPGDRIKGHTQTTSSTGPRSPNGKKGQ